MTRDVGHRVVILSPHFDDGVFSLGASIAQAVARGSRVTVLTIFGNDPESRRAASSWDAACGFSTEGEATAARREEDRRACLLVGADPAWLSHHDEEYRDALDEDALWSDMRDVVESADAVICPGFPLYHPDHRLLTELVAQRLRRPRLALYVEQPYASWRLMGRGRRTWTLPGLTLQRSIVNIARIVARTPEGRRLQQPVLPEEIAGILRGRPAWTPVRAGARASLAKQRAVQAYTSQLRGFGPLVGTRIALYELAFGGEGVAWLRH